MKDTDRKATKDFNVLYRRLISVFAKWSWFIWVCAAAINLLKLGDLCGALPRVRKINGQRAWEYVENKKRLQSDVFTI